MTDKPTGVFVQLHDGELSFDQRRWFQQGKSGEHPNSVGNGGILGGLLAIGTPVTGEELDYCAQIVWYEYAVEPEVAAWRNHDIKKGDNLKVVRQSDALAKLAEKDAEIVELREAEAHARADAEAAKARVERFRKIVDVFSAKISECASEGHDLSGADCVDLLNDAGVIEWGVFDPEVHDYATFDGCDAGDPIWTLKGPEA